MASRTSYAVAATTEEGADDESPSSSPRPGDVLLIAEAQVLGPQQQHERGSLSRLSEGLTWEDDYYNDNEDIVAVFDVDGKTVRDYHYCLAQKSFQVGLPFFALYIFYPFSIYSVVYVYITAFFSFLIFMSCSHARLASAKIHMAVTSDCIQYDQESPNLNIMVSYVIDCTALIVSRKETTSSITILPLCLMCLLN
jgi:hypothetical protein